MAKKKSKANSSAKTPYSRSREIVRHIESYEYYLDLTSKAVSIYFFVVAGSATLFHANYRHGIESPKIYPWVSAMSSIGFATIFFIGAFKWMKKRRSYKRLIIGFEQSPDTEMLTIALLVSGCMCVAVAFMTVKLFGLL